MDNKLCRLILDYQKKVKTAVILMKRSGIPMPYSIIDWVYTDIPYEGKLDGGIKYLKHGAGCLVSLDSGDVDFDFSEDGEIGGFNLWWLTKFASNCLADFGFENEVEIVECFENALNTGELVYSSCNDGLYFIANNPRVFAVDIDCRLSGDILPDRNQDRVLILQSHYFQVAVVMLEQYEKLKKRMKKIKHLNGREDVELRIYLCNWLGFLAVTCEGFNQLNIHLLLERKRPDSFKELMPLSDDLTKRMKTHADSLRILRNNIFHLCNDFEDILQFFNKDTDRLLWARELHTAIEQFFSKYRIECEIHYIVNGRKGESGLIMKRKSQKQN